MEFQNKQVFILTKSCNNMDLINSTNSFDIIGVFSTRLSAESQMITIGANLNFAYKIFGPYNIDNNISPNLKPDFTQPMFDGPDLLKPKSIHDRHINVKPQIHPTILDYDIRPNDFFKKN